MITIVNKYKHVTTANDIYIGRGSILGNPFSNKEDTKALFKVDTKEEAMENYKIWLEDNFKNNIKVRNYVIAIKETSNTVDLNLVCFCKPKSCHGDIIKDFVENLDI